MNNSPASSGSSFQVQNSGGSSGEGIEEQRKRKRMISNRESARRSRMRKQKHLDELMSQASQLSNDNNRILTSINMVTHLYENVEAQNSVLRAQMSELTHRLQSLNEIVMNCINFGVHEEMIGGSSGVSLFDHHQHHEIVDCADDFLGSWNLINNQPIMASADAFMY